MTPSQATNIGTFWDTKSLDTAPIQVQVSSDKYGTSFGAYLSRTYTLNGVKCRQYGLQTREQVADLKHQIHSVNPNVVVEILNPTPAEPLPEAPMKPAEPNIKLHRPKLQELPYHVEVESSGPMVTPFREGLCSTLQVGKTVRSTYRFTNRKKVRAFVTYIKRHRKQVKVLSHSEWTKKKAKQRPESEWLDVTVEALVNGAMQSALPVLLINGVDEGTHYQWVEEEVDMQARLRAFSYRVRDYNTLRAMVKYMDEHVEDGQFVAARWINLPKHVANSKSCDEFLEHRVRLLKKKAEAMQDELGSTQVKLGDTRKDLAQTRHDLVATKAKLQDAQNRALLAKISSGNAGMNRSELIEHTKDKISGVLRQSFRLPPEADLNKGLTIHIDFNGRREE